MASQDLVGGVWALDLLRLGAYVPSALERLALTLKVEAPESSAVAGFLDARRPGGDAGLRGSGARVADQIAHIPIVGFLAPRTYSLLAELLFGGASMAAIREAVTAAAASPDVKGILLEIDSPGGAVYGAHETFAAIRAAAARKPVVAAINGLGASAAYWLAAAADRIVVTPSGEAGSIGVLGVHEDRSAFYAAKGVVHTVVASSETKSEGLDVLPLSADAKAAMQRRVDQSYARFVADVATGRRTTVDAVRAGYGEGRVLGAEDARAAGLVDEIGTVEAATSRLVGFVSDQRRRQDLAALRDEAALAAVEKE